MSVNSHGKFKPTVWTIVRAILLAAWLVFSLELMSLVVFIPVSLLPSSFEPLTTSTVGQLTASLVVYILSLGMTVGIPYVISTKIKKRPHQLHATRLLLGLVKSFKWKHIRLLVVCIFGYFGLTILAASIARFVPGFDSNQEQAVGFMKREGVLNLVLAFLALVVLPPIIEELLFRGYLFGKLRQQSGFIFSTLITSLIFGLVHLQWNVSLDTFVLSLFLCYLREKTGAIWMNMMLHAFKNSLAYFLLFIAPLLGINVT